ncbi:MAG: hypothetical protein ACYC1I_11705 [Acidimicrobiales bacterium]
MSMIHATPAAVQPSPIRLVIDDVQAIEDDFRPTFEDRVEPSAWDAAYWLGFTLAASGEEAEPPFEMTSRMELEAYYGGRLDGEIRAERERIMRDWAIDDAMADELAREVHECERRGVC